MAESASADAARTNVTPETILTARRERAEAKDALETAKARYRNCGKKIESWGIDIKQLDRVIEFARRDQDELGEEFRTFIHYARVLQVPIGTQLSLLDDQDKAVDLSERAKEEQAAWDAGQQGLNAAKNNEPASNNPFTAGTLAHSAWAEAHRQQRQKMEEGLVPRRGRPPGSGKKQQDESDQQAA